MAEGSSPSVSPETDRGPTHGAVVLFIATIITAVLLVFAGTWYAVYSSNRNAQSIEASQQAQDRRWCDVLTLLTSVPVTKPADPKSNPSREGQYKLYTDFVKLRTEFRC